MLPDSKMAWLLAILVLFASSCGEVKKEGQYVGIPETALTEMKQGDLALRRGRDVASYMVSQAGAADKRFSHCGLVQIEDGYPFVYHFINGQSRNGLVRDSAVVFFSPVHSSLAAIMRYEMTTEEQEIQTALIQQYYDRQPGFDMSFDTRTGDKLYCSEFVYRVMNAVMNDSGYIKPVARKGFAYIPLDKLYADNRAETIWQMSFK